MSANAWARRGCLSPSSWTRKSHLDHTLCSLWPWMWMRALTGLGELSELNWIQTWNQSSFSLFLDDPWRASSFSHWFLFKDQAHLVSLFILLFSLVALVVSLFCYLVSVRGARLVSVSSFGWMFLPCALRELFLATIALGLARFAHFTSKKCHKEFFEWAMPQRIVFQNQNTLWIL